MASRTEDRLDTLKQQIRDLEHRIHVLEFPPAERDQLRGLMAALSALEAEGGGPALDSPSLRRSGQPRAAFTLRTHDGPWPEPSAVASVAELKAFHAQVMAADGPDTTFVATATMPGVEVELTYEEGVLKRAVLKGDGLQGDDVTDNVRTVPSVPLRLRPPGTLTESRVTKPTGQSFGPTTTRPVPPFPSRLQVRMIFVQRNVDLTALDRRRVDAGDPPYVLPRGAVMGSLRRLDPRITASRRLAGFALGCPVPPAGIDSQWLLLGALKSWGFAIQPITWRCQGLQEVLDFVASLQQLAPTYDYPLEGGLLRANRFRTTARQVEARLSFPPPGRPAVVERVYYAVGRGGSVLPVALVGKTPEHDLPIPERAPVPAHDGSQVLPVKKGVRIRVRPGPVAPVMVLDDEFAEPRQRITDCPACGEVLDLATDEPFGRCVNMSCPGRARARMLHLVGPRGLRLSALNVKAVDRLIGEHGAVDVPGFFALDATQLERIAPGLGAQITQALGAHRRMPLWRFLYLSAIPHVSEHEARTLVRHVQSAERLERLTASEAHRIDGLTPEAARGLTGWLAGEGHNAFPRARQAGLTLLGDDEAFSAPFFDKTVVVAGELELGTVQLADEIERRGGIIQARVGRDTDLVIVGKSAQKTFDTAVMYGVPVLEEGAVNRVLRETGPISNGPNMP